MDFPPGRFMRTALPGPLQEVFQKLAGVGFGILRESFRRAGTDQLPHVARLRVQDRSTSPRF